MKRFKLTALCLTFGLLLSNTNVFAAEKKPTIDTSNKIEIQLPNGNTVNPTAVVLKVSYSQFVDNGYEYFTFTPR